MLQHELASVIARVAHLHQLDEQGCSYFRHVQRVADSITMPYHKAAAFLHDVIEDSDLTITDLRKLGIEAETANAVFALTKQVGENYFDYIRRVEKNSIARDVKLSDLKDNLDISRMQAALSEHQMKRIQKYVIATLMLKGLWDIKHTGEEAGNGNSNQS